MRKYTVLQSSVLDMQCDTTERRTRTFEMASSPDTEDTAGVAIGSPIRIGSRSTRGFSDPGTPDLVAYNTTAPLEQVSSAGGSGTARPSTPVGGGAADGNANKGSPQGERYFGRGETPITRFPGH
jgi:hypothetical protein